MRIPLSRMLLSSAVFALYLLGSFCLPGADRSPAVLNGIDVLRERGFDLLSGKRVGLVTNHTGLAADGTSTIDLLFRSKACRLAVLFSPEHGIRGTMDENVRSSVDEQTGLPVHSLYGDSRRPAPETLKDIDALVFDVQDIGARFYTYIATMAYCMEEAAKAHIQFIVLDRPNPIGGARVEGPMLDADKTSFNGYMPLPVRHGMTVGELARYFNTENRIGAQLQVVPMRGWRRSCYFWDTGQVWVNPSPNMRSMPAALLYPGVCLLERTDLSVGRGTDRPFETVGAPWIEPGRFAAALREARIPGVQYIPVYFIPDASRHKGARCGGVNLLVTDADRLNSVLLGLTLASVLNKLYPDAFKMDTILDFLGNASAMDMLKAGQPPAKVLHADDSDLRRFLARRQKALIYD
ncbi:MAG: hypothetical protein H6Q07_2338 [Acidobacteria bacterium]|nr:hypothetical protein [Acidobacteriota bacterium]